VDHAIAGTRLDRLGFGGVLTGALVCAPEEAHLAVIRGVALGVHIDRADEDLCLRVLHEEAPVGTDVEVLYGQAVITFGGLHNAFVNQGLQRFLDVAFNATEGSLSGVSHIGLSADAQAVTASTTSLDPAGGASGTSIKAVANVSRTGQTMHADQTWTQADVGWAIRKIGLLYGPSASDVINIIGGVGGSSPFNEDFTIDLTAISSWSLTMGIDVTATAS